MRCKRNRPASICCEREVCYLTTVSKPSVIQRLARSTAVHVAGAFVAMGSWAVFANADAGAAPALMAGAVQGSLSAFITLTLKRSLEGLAQRMLHRGLPAFVLPLVLCLGTSFIVLVSSHVLAGTPNVVATIAVPFSVASTYATIYRFTLWKSSRSHDVN